MDADALVRLLQEALPDVPMERAPSLDAHPTLCVDRDHLPGVAQALRNREELHFDLLAELTAADYWPREPRFEVVYVLVSIDHLHRLRLKVPVHGDRASVATVSGVWPAANWLEREVWDLFGIAFDGHPDLRRLLMPEDWEGFPLRKDYPVQIRMPARISEPIQMSEEEFRRNLERDRVRRSS